jgi:hypothetical protein
LISPDQLSALRKRQRLIQQSTQYYSYHPLFSKQTLYNQNVKPKPFCRDGTPSNRLDHLDETFAFSAKLSWRESYW